MRCSFSLTSFSLLFLAVSTPAQHFVVANRNAANISVHRASDGTRERVVALPGGAATPEPMYVQHVGDEVLVGDRANDRVVRFAAADYSVLGTVAAGRGVFHMWAGDRQLWVNNDIDNTASVIDTASMQNVRTVPMPADLVAAGYKPHDVFVGRRFAWVSMLGGSGASDWVVQFDQRTFVERRRAAVGGDPHLWWDEHGRRLFVASQASSEVVMLQSDTLRPLSQRSVSGAHGVFMAAGTQTLLVTDITGNGQGDLLALGGVFGLPIQDQVDTGVATAHNIAASELGTRVMVTHSGATSTTVTLYAMHNAVLPWVPFGLPMLEKLATVAADANPFGLAYVR